MTTACHANVQRWFTFFKPMFLFMCMHLHASVTANEKKIGRTIWWIVSYMASISNPVIYGVNNRVYSQACSLVVFLFVARWQKYYSQITHLLYPTSFTNLYTQSLLAVVLQYLVLSARPCARMWTQWDSLWHTFYGKGNNNGTLAFQCNSQGKQRTKFMKSSSLLIWFCVGKKHAKMISMKTAKAWSCAEAWIVPQKH